MKLSPDLYFHKEEDKSATLINQANGNIYYLNPVSALIVEELLKGSTREQILAALSTHVRNLPEAAEKDMDDFLDSLRQASLLDE